MTRFLKWAVSLLCLGAAALFVAVLLVPAVLGLQRYVIVGGSMTGTIDKGSVAYARLTPVGQLKAGDIITFVPPSDSRPVTHRVVSIKRSEQGELVFRTKGDANTTIDPWKITFPRPQQARYVFHVRYVGYLLALLSIRSVRLLLIGLPALVIAVSILWSLWRSAGEEVRRREAQQASSTAAQAGCPAAQATPTAGLD
jgi:signal peptidase I